MVRRAFDFYPTPQWATEELLNRLPVQGRVLEPCCGDGAIASALQGRDGCELVTNDVDPRWPADWHQDARDEGFWQAVGECDWVVTNPPFSVASDILPLAYRHAKAVAMLLRLSYLEPCEGRAGWLAAHPPDQLLVLPRISFTGNGKTDSVTCAWMVWAPVVWGNAILVIPPVDDRQGSLLEASA